MRLCNATSFSKTIFTPFLRFCCKYAGEMASKSQKRHTLQCFRGFKKSEKSSRSAQNASKSSILHLQFALAVVTYKPSKISPKRPQKSAKTTPRRLQDGPSEKFKPSNMMLNIKSTPKSPKKPSKKPLRGPQEAPKRLPNGHKTPPKGLRRHLQTFERQT